VREVRANVGAGLHLPDLRRHADHARPRHLRCRERIDIDANGEIVGLS
jgi:hypothetical protein